MPEPLRLLLVEDNDLDARLVRSLLTPRSVAPPFLIDHVQDLATAVQRVGQGRYDVALSDLALPDSVGLETFRALHGSAPQVPVVVLTVHEDQETALQAVSEGAQDYLVKGEIDERRLTRALLYAVERQRLVDSTRSDLEHGASPAAVTSGGYGDHDEVIVELRASLAHEQEKRRRLEDLNRLNTDFLGMIAHDLRSPVQVISAYAEMLLRRPETTSPEKSREYLRRIHRGSHHLSGLIDNVLTLARTEAGLSFVYSQKPFDLRALIETVANDLNSLEASPRVLVQLPEPLPAAFGDEHRYWQVLTNLVSNALKFSDREHPVTVVARVVADALEVSVSDRGHGIAPEDVPRLFRRFSRLPPREAAHARPGTGLGLYISQQIVIAQQGRIWVESAPASGSTFRFTLPIAPREAVT